ncbi:hypothetical protein KDA82_13310, partial [Streptomyces daliensis]|nr:hypothetical protein [Streptomyces daliensis]
MNQAPLPGRRSLLRLGAGLTVAGLATGTGTGTGWAATRSSARSGSTATAWNALAHGLDGTLVRPGDHDYATARLLFNPRFDAARPSGVAYCATSQDVRECLAFAR